MIEKFNVTAQYTVVPVQPMGSTSGSTRVNSLGLKDAFVGIGPAGVYLCPTKLSPTAS